MGWSFRLFRVAGISVDVHVLFLLIFAIYLLVGVQEALFLLMVFTIVLAHEFVHSLVALSQGVQVPRILILPFGGLATIPVPEDPEKELKISIAGPAFNFLLAGVFTVGVYALGIGFIPYPRIVEGLMDGSLSMADPAVVLNTLISINVLLGGFNMLPAFPMDGGRVLRAVLAFWMPYVTATRVAGLIGRLIFGVILVVGVFVNLWWVLVAGFLFLAGGSEVNMVRARHRLRGYTVASFMDPRIHPVHEDATAEEFTRRIATPGIRYYTVVDDGGRLTGILTAESVPPGSSGKILSYSRPVPPAVDASAPLEAVVEALQRNTQLLAVDGNKLVGVVDAGELKNRLP